MLPLVTSINFGSEHICMGGFHQFWNITSGAGVKFVPAFGQNFLKLAQNSPSGASYSNLVMQYTLSNGTQNYYDQSL